MQSRGLLFCLFFMCLVSAPVLAADVSADLNRDGIVNAQDQFLLEDQWHTDGAVENSPSPEEIANCSILGVSIPADNKPIVTFSLVDGNGNPISPTTPPLYRIRYLMGVIIEDNLAAKRSHYESVIKTVNGSPTYDSGGVPVSVGNGVWSVKFKNAIVSPNKAFTHTLAIQGAFDKDGDLQRCVFNPIFNFRPDGGVVTTVRELSTTETCNKCHDPLAIHGGTRREYVMCLICHNPDLPEADMANMAHQIHMSDAFINANNAAGTAHDGINSVSGPEIINEEFITYPQDIRNCNTCHTGSEAHPEQAQYCFQVPSMLSCGGCHDKIDFANGIGHMAQADDSMCAACHPSDVGFKPVKPAHVVPSQHPDVNNVFVDIVAVDNVAPATKPIITFRVYQEVNNVTQTVKPSQLNRLAACIAGLPGADYTFDRTETITDANSIDNGNGTRSYVFSYVIDPSATAGTFGFAMEARGNAQTILGESVRPGADNPVVYVPLAVPGNMVHERRDIIKWDSCLECHESLPLHGSNRNQYEYCVMCHRPGADDEARRVAGSLPPESIDFKYMIHKIHMGDELEGDYTVYGFGNIPYDFTEVTFPGDRRNCEKCHKEGTYNLPTPGDLNTTVTQDSPAPPVVVKDLTPGIASCGACHDTAEATEHMNSFLAIDGNNEKCAECHGPAEQWSVEKMHYTGF